MFVAVEPRAVVRVISAVAPSVEPPVTVWSVVPNFTVNLKGVERADVLAEVEDDFRAVERGLGRIVAGGDQRRLHAVDPVVGRGGHRGVGEDGSYTGVRGLLDRAAVGVELVGLDREAVGVLVVRGHRVSREHERRPRAPRAVSQHLVRAAHLDRELRRPVRRVHGHRLAEGHRRRHRVAGLEGAVRAGAVERDGIDTGAGGDFVCRRQCDRIARAPTQPRVAPLEYAEVVGCVGERERDAAHVQRQVGEGLRGDGRLVSPDI